MTTEENIEVREDLPTENKRQSIKKARPGLKLLLIVGMCVAFLIPQVLIRNLVTERQSTELNAENEVFAKWGGNQTMIGPVIEVPYSLDSTAKERYYMLLLPENLDIKGGVSTKALKRGIYDFTVFETSLDLSGQFKLPKDFESSAKDKIWHFDEARILIDITHLRGLSDNVTFNLGGTQRDMDACTNPWNGLCCPVDLTSLFAGETLDFAVTIPF